MIARACGVILPHCSTLVAAWSRGKHSDEVRARLDALRANGVPPESRLDLVPLLRFFYGEPVEVAATTPEELERQQSVYFERYYHALPLPPGSLATLWQHCKGGPACREGLRDANRFATTRQLPPAWVAQQR